MSNYTDVAYTGDKNTTWFKMFNNIPEKSRVLDIGCSSGNFGEELQKSKGCEVIGVDLDKDDVKRAAKLLKAAHVMNIETDDFSKLGKFDRVIFADVLEHLVDPVASLQKVKKLLKPGGQVLFSIPNMAHMGTRLMLLTGKFGYEIVRHKWGGERGGGRVAGWGLGEVIRRSWAGSGGCNAAQGGCPSWIRRDGTLGACPEAKGTWAR